MLAAPLAGLILIKKPALVALVAIGCIIAAAIEAPATVLALFGFTHLATPAYLRLPLPGGLFNPPVSTGIMVLLFTVGLARLLSGRQLPSLAPGTRRSYLLFGLFAVVALLSLLDPQTTSEGFKMWIKVFVFPGLISVALVCLVTTTKEANRLFLILLAGALTACAYGVFENLLGRNPLIDHFQPPDVVYFRSEILGDLAYRSFSVFGNPIEYGTCIGMIAVYPLVRFATATTWRSRTLFGLAVIICYLGILVSYSRGPMLALMTATLIIALCYPVLRRWLIAAALTGAVALLAIWPFIGSGLSERLRDVDNVSLRFKLWQTASALYRDHPVMGVGLGNFPEYYIQAARDHRIGPFYEFGEDSLETIRVAENTYLQLAAETGTIGIITAVAFVLSLIWLALRMTRHTADRTVRDLALVCLGSMLVYGINGAFITAYTHYFATLLLIGFVMGMVFALDRINVTQHDSRAEKDDAA